MTVAALFFIKMAKNDQKAKIRRKANRPGLKARREAAKHARSFVGHKKEVMEEETVIEKNEIVEVKAPPGIERSKE